MTWYEWITVGALGVSLGVSLSVILRLIRLGTPRDNAPAAGKTGPAIRYAMTGAMNPAKKESAYLHLPTYIAGMLFHLGTFLSLVVFLFVWIRFPFPEWVRISLACFLAITAACGIGILLKRTMKKELRDLSNPDDYISNILVTLFQTGTLLILFIPELLPVYFILASMLFLYMPIGKLKHVIYFFAARYHLGFFYGWRGVWPPLKRYEGMRV